MLTEQELKDKVQAFIKEHADICYQIEEERQKDLRYKRVVVTILMILAALGLLVTYYYPPVILLIVFVVTPISFFFFFPMWGEPRPY